MERQERRPAGARQERSARWLFRIARNIAIDTLLRKWLAGTPEDRGPIEGNHRLTALTGSLLAPLLALIFLTGLFMDAWWHIHYAVGFILIAVVALKLASTGYRAMRYYTGDPTYRAAGPPDLVPRLIAPLLVLSVVIALATGVALYAEHSRSGTLGTLHTDAAVISALRLGNPPPHLRPRRPGYHRS